ncbi:ABC transporter permease [Paenibacillus sp. D51F]|uniref:ABC transporter permease n=1 Tax=unclassified Paenibacillus TaxID=185978 RepID=UPI00095471F2|nr:MULTISPECIES: ABC transporter permease [unclassified Paenibacillus]ASS67719.1 ABC transporter permease [Paenibacillus sp. RUD330]SIR67354.1 simple sugar transport system permease protein [Paenibacillus sp. RU4X]SIR75151.1 simple sugar transport system permease protein [Paenibacillus sp. RU4T]
MDLLAQLINTTLVFSTALILAALGGIFSERSGVVNIGLEGLMIVGAFSAAVFTYFSSEWGFGGGSPWFGLLMAVVCGVIFSLLHAVASITLKANQVIIGVVINILALGATIYLVKSLFDGQGQSENLTGIAFTKWNIPGLSDIPFIGEALFKAYPTTYICYVLVFLSWFVLYRTRFGLRLRAVGEHPGAADTVGISVTKYRYIGVMLSGAFAGLGGAAISLTTTYDFSHTTISGQGFIAIAAIIFGRWHPIGAAGAALFFGFAQALRFQAQLFEWSKAIPNEFLYMLPYVLTLLLLAFAAGKNRAPAAAGEPYDPGKR